MREACQTILRRYADLVREGEGLRDRVARSRQAVEGLREACRRSAVAAGEGCGELLTATRRLVRAAEPLAATVHETGSALADSVQQQGGAWAEGIQAADQATESAGTAVAAVEEALGGDVDTARQRRREEAGQLLELLGKMRMDAEEVVLEAHDVSSRTAAIRQLLETTRSEDRVREQRQDRQRAIADFCAAVCRCGSGVPAGGELSGVAFSAPLTEALAAGGHETLANALRQRDADGLYQACAAMLPGQDGVVRLARAWQEGRLPAFLEQSQQLGPAAATPAEQIAHAMFARPAGPLDAAVAAAPARDQDQEDRP